MIGIITRWGAKGYGFVKCSELETEAWLHAKFIDDPDYQPHQGDQVEFTPEKLPDGRYQARKVRLVGASTRPRETSRPDGPPRSAYGGSGGGSSGGGFGVKLALGGFTLQPKPAPAAVLPPEPVIEDVELPPEEPTRATEESAAPESAPSLPLRERLVEERRRREATAGQLKAAAAQVEQSIRTLTERLARFQTDAAALEAGGPAADAALVEAAVGEAAFELENGLFEQRRLRDAVEAARRLALQRNGLPPLEKYEGVRRRLREASGQDELILEAFRTLERQQRLPLRDYAEALDRLDAAEKVSARFITFTTPDGAEGPHSVVVVAPLKVQALAGAGAADLATRIAIAFWHAAARVVRELGADAEVEHGAVCGSVAVRCAALDAHLFPMILEETWAARPVLAELGAEPCCELVDNVVPAFEPEPEPEDEDEDESADGASDDPDTSKVDLAAVTGTALADVASRLGLAVHAVVELLLYHGLSSPDDHVDAGTESTLRALLGERTEGGEARAARADAASGEAGAVELPGPAGVASRMLKKLLTDRRVGGRHTRIEHAYGHHFSDEEKEVARRVALWLEKDGIFLPKLNEGSHHISINPRRLRDVGAIIEGTWDRRADLEAIV